MKRFANIIAFVAVLLALQCSSVAQGSGDVIIQLRVPPPNQMTLADFWTMSLTNTTQSPRKIFLVGVGTEVRDGEIVQANTTPFTVPANRTIFLDGNFFTRTSGGAQIDVNSYKPRYESIIRSTGTVPSGDYTVCVFVMDAETRREISRDCFQQTIEQVTPPILLSPDKGGVILDSLPTFTWLAPTPIPNNKLASIRYKIQIHQVNGFQSPEQSVKSNPPYFESANLIAPLMLYPISARKLVLGDRYAWKVIAYIGNVALGESEIWSFTFDASLFDTTMKKKITQAKVVNPIINGILSAGDTHCGATFDAKEPMKGAIVGLKDGLTKSGFSISSIGADNTLFGEVITKNSRPKSSFASYTSPGGDSFISESIIVSSKKSASTTSTGSESEGTSAALVSKSTSTEKASRGGTDDLATRPGIDFIKTGPASDPGSTPIEGTKEGEDDMGTAAALKVKSTPPSTSGSSFGMLSSAGLGIGAVETKSAVVDGSEKFSAPKSESIVGKGITVKELEKTSIGSLDNLIQKPDNSIEKYLWMWGRNVEGEVGFMAPAWFTATPVPYDFGGKKVKQIACGATHTLVLLEDGTVWGWGDNQFGQLADANVRERNAAAQIPGLSNVIQIAAGMGTSFAVKSDYTLWSWGYNNSGELGLGMSKLGVHEVTSPTKVTLNGTEGCLKIAARNGHAVAVGASGNVYTWGSNYYGESGNGYTQTFSHFPNSIGKITTATPVSLPMLSGGVSVAHKTVACGDYHSVIVDVNGKVWAWGRNASGQLGNGSIADTSKPVRVSKGESLSSTSSKISESFTTTRKRFSPTYYYAPLIVQLTDIDSIACGGAHTLARTTDGSLLLWGNNSGGQLATNSRVNKDAPVSIAEFGSITSFSAGSGNSLVIKKSGGLWTWGQNNFGQNAIAPISDCIFTKKDPQPPTRVVTLEK